MKKFLLCALFVLTVFSIKAQAWVYHPFPTDSAIWNIANGTYNVTSCCPAVIDYYPNPPVRFCMTSADTTIGANTYSQLFLCGSSYFGALRDDSIARKVYYVPADSLNEKLVYDFSVNSGDTTALYINVFGDPNNSGTYATLIGSVDSILINGTYRKRVNVNGGDFYIEGIGAFQGLFHEFWPNVSNYYSNLECMSEGNTTLYPVAASGPCSLTSGVAEAANEPGIEIFPNPFFDKVSLRSAGKMEQIIITDLLGRVVKDMRYNDLQVEIDLSDLQDAIYFVTVKDKKGNLYVDKIIKE